MSETLVKEMKKALFWLSGHTFKMWAYLNFYEDLNGMDKNNEGNDENCITSEDIMKACCLDRSKYLFACRELEEAEFIRLEDDSEGEDEFIL